MIQDRLPPRHLVWALGLLALAAMATAWTVSVGQQPFGAFSAAKKILLPATYAVIVLLLLFARPASEGSERWFRGLSAWMWWPVVGSGLSLIVNLFRPHPHTIADTLQGLALFTGFSVLVLAGFQAGPWSRRTRQSFLCLLMVTAVLAAVFFRSGGPTPFSSLVVPSAFATLALSGAIRRFRWPLILLVGLFVGMVGRVLQPNPAIPISSALLAQIAICGAATLVWHLPRLFRWPALAIGFAVGAVLFIQRGGPALLSGQTTSDDVTIAHRSYEAAQVLQAWRSSQLTLVFGLGPAGTVNLADSPDADTLLASGRNIAAVDDVHLLSAYLLLKLGLLGMVWAALLAIALARLSISILLGRDRDVWSFSLLLYVLAGVANSLPAATNLLSNVLVPLSLGILWQRRVASERARRLEPGDSVQSGAGPQVREDRSASTATGS